ncbi:NAD(P)/FAD-dependent oxidoreductase [Wenzhouxiangella sp. XN24]|uniref:NAD(P)/FAD-dependent oxidoreductase n=1 Tax=Wenzhouxiangella sp. XN24 TaxID=2713569 RepID=UPI0013EA38B5|nr:NAD(P)/FAD-dependent oxidoreductase [Wenzhouxiangella sp. XN24]NGX17004.1 NAD(P)/FAD-dependent oxidoreductase [Wenzhouxiangella sp. XN24]
MHRIVIVGGGAGGIGTATRLGRKLGRKGSAHVTLVDRVESHVWKPLLHEVATGALDTGIDAVSYRGHAAANGYHFQQGRLAGLDRANRRVVLAPIYDGATELLPARDLEYDYLVIAIGSVANDFGIPGVKRHCLFLDDTEQAMGIRKILLNRFLRYASHEQRQERIKVAIVGAGATGTEMAAEMHHAVDQLRGYGYKIDTSLLDVTLIEADERILPKVGRDKISDSVARELERIGVQVLTNTRVVEVTDRNITFQGGYVVAADIVIWSAGIRGPDVLRELGGLETNRINQLVVRPTAQTTRDDRVFAIGDCCACPQDDGSWVPPRGQAARQLGHVAADNIMSMMRGEAPDNVYVYKDLGSLVNLSRFHTVGNLFSFLGGGVMVEGRIARFTYLSLYRRHLIELYGPVRGVLMILLKSLHRVIRPHLKLH